MTASSSVLNPESTRSSASATQDAKELQPVIRDTLAGIARRILSTMDPTREDRLFPADYQVFVTNPMNISYGAMGVALFLWRVLGSLPDAVAGWIRKQHLSGDDYPPGLLTGLSGIAYAFLQLGMIDEAVAALRLAGESPLLFNDPSYGYGAAGWGWVNLEFNRVLREQSYLDSGIQAGEYLAVSASEEPERTCWGDPTKTLPLGIANGASGIALFLGRLYEVTGDHTYSALADRALRFDLSYGRHTERDVRFPSSTVEDGTRPYWLNGTAGIASCLIRLPASELSGTYLELARRAVLGSHTIFTVYPGLFEGMTGIGELVADMYQVTGETQYRAACLDVVNGILCFQSVRPNGICFPGKRLIRFSNDYATGSAGIGLYLARVLEPTGRLFHDPMDLRPLATPIAV